MQEWLNGLKFRVRTLLRRNQLERDLQDELSFHVAMREGSLREEGKSDPEAAARRRFGNITRLQEETREPWTFGALERLLRDIRYSLRLMRKNWGLTLAVTVSLALGIGITASIFSIVDFMLLRSLSVPEPDRVVRIIAGTKSDPLGGEFLSYPDLEDLRNRTQSFAGITAWNTRNLSLAVSPAQDSRMADCAIVSGNFFSTLRLQPVLGRGFLPEEDEAPGKAAVAVISYRLWQRDFGGDSNVIGKRIRINSTELAIVGVAPRSFNGYDIVQPQVYVPRMILSRLIPSESVTSRWTASGELFGRLTPGATIQSAREDVRRIAAQMEEEQRGLIPDLRLTVYSQLGLIVAREPWRVAMAGLLSLLAALVLGIACVNVATLLLAITYTWSPDSKWLAYAMNNTADISTGYAHSVEQNRSFQVSDGRRDVSNPAFDKSGKYLFFLASTDPGGAEKESARIDAAAGLFDQGQDAARNRQSLGPSRSGKGERTSCER